LLEKNKQLKNIAIQGVKGSFHEQAAIQFFGAKVKTIECETFPDFFEKMEGTSCDSGVMAIENSVAGTIHNNYLLLKDSPFQIIGEIYLRIQHNFMALKNQSIESIESVCSHKMALLQCTQFLKEQKHIKVIEDSDTALVAQRIAEQKLKGVAAIASKRAAEINGLEILKSNIENNPRNFTRFLVLERKSSNSANLEIGNKVSLSFHLENQPGSLAQVLSTFNYYRFNLTKIQSMPVVGKEWEYYFHIDLEYDDAKLLEKCFNAIEHYISEFKILGAYKKGLKDVG